MSRSEIFRRILMGFSIVLLSCAIKNHLTFLISGSAWCQYLCPSAFQWGVVRDMFGLKQLFIVQQALLSGPQIFINKYITDQWNLVTYLVVAPVIEEIIYRGPFYLTQNRSNRAIWWIIGFIAVGVFALSHGRSGMAIIPVIALGCYNLWLVAKTGRLWPAISLHFLYNFFFVSVMLYQSPWIGD